MINKPLSKLTSISLILVAVAMITGTVIIFVRRDSASTSSADLSSQVTETPANTVAERDTNAAETTTVTPAPDSQVIPEKNPNTTQTIPTSQKLNVAITRIAKNQVGDQVLIKASITGSSSGTCTVTATKGSSSVSGTAAISYSGAEYGCGSLSIPTASFNESGVWKFTLVVDSSDGSNATATSDETVGL